MGEIVADAVFATIWFVAMFFWLLLISALPSNLRYEIRQKGGLAGKFAGVAGQLFWIPVLGGLVWATILLAPWFIPSFEFAYKLHNVVTPKASVRLYSIVEKPHDCEFGTAPLGNKHCHYEPAISTESGVPVGRWDLDELFDRQSRHTVSWNRVED
jgi:hypothetical protein